MANWIRVTSVADCPPGSSSEWVVDGHVVALFNVDGNIYALDGICPHQGGPLGKGELQGNVVTCPWHGWQFNVTTGQHQVNASLCHSRWQVKVEHDSVYVALPD